MQFVMKSGVYHQRAINDVVAQGQWAMHVLTGRDPICFLQLSRY